jgi:hypothetical protein
MWDALKNIGLLVTKDPAMGAKNVSGKLNKTMRGSSFIKKNPLAVATAGLGLGGAAVYGGSKLINRNGGSDDFLFMPPGGYTPSGSNQFYDSLLDAHAQGIHEMNRKYHGSAQRRAELQEAIDNNLPGSARAMAELQQLERERAATGKVRSDYLNRVTASGVRSAEKLREIEENQRKTEAAKTNWWRAPQRMWLRMTGRDPNTYFDDKKLQLESEASRHQTNARLREDERRMIENGVIRSSSKSKTPSEMQRTFFPTY